MKKNKIQIKNINKKLIALGLTFALIPTAFAGCAEKNSTAFVYEKNEQGQYECVENVEYSYLENCVVVVFELEGKEFMQIAKLDRYGDSIYGWREIYSNIFGGQEIYDSKDKDSKMSIVYKETLSSYLAAYNKVQHEYTEEEMKEILDQIKKDYELQKNKQLIKE